MWHDPTRRIRAPVPPDKSWVYNTVWQFHAWTLTDRLRLVAVAEITEREFPSAGWKLEEKDGDGWVAWHVPEGAWVALMGLREK